MPDTATTDAALAALAPVDSVAIPAAELVRLRADAAKSSQADARLADLERETADSFLGRDLASILSAVPLVAGAAGHVTKLLRDDLEAVRVDGQWVTRAKDGRSLAETVKARLDSAEFAMFRPAGSRGGSGAQSTTPAATNTVGHLTGAGGSLGHQMIAQGMAASGSPMLAKYRR